tara:strand:- start:259 stop:459 length:201 start_codon:yes stop_codon:yes gene_type:complete
MIIFNTLDIKKAKYFKDPSTKKVVSINVELNNSDIDLSVPVDEQNNDYLEVKRQVDAGELTIEDAD